jgi:hypothetical protein
VFALYILEKTGLAAIGTNGKKNIRHKRRKKHKKIKRKHND